MGLLLLFIWEELPCWLFPALETLMVRLAGAMLCGLAEEWELPFDKTTLSVPDVVFPGLSFIVCTGGCVFFGIEEGSKVESHFGD